MRNSQATVLAPDRHDRPDDGLRHHRHRARPRARQDEEARRRRHDVRSSTRRSRGRCAGSATTPAQVDDIVAYIDEHKSIIGRPAPARRAPAGVRLLDGRQHDPLHGPRADDGRGPAVHLGRDLARPSTCPRTPRSRRSSSCTIESWKLGLKAVAIYRDNCKVAQPLSTDKKKTRRPRTDDVASVETIVHAGAPEPAAEPAVDDVRVPGRRLQGLRHGRRVPTTAGRARSSSTSSKQGSTLAGIMDAFAIVDLATACSTACRCGPSSRSSPTCGSSRRA